MYKVGDKFEVVCNRKDDDLVNIGDVVTLEELCSDRGGRFSYPNGKEFWAGFYSQPGISRNVRPLRTEAEKRGAKFGVGGVLKYTGERLVFISDDGYVWRVIKEGSQDTQVYTSFEIRLDHETEYKEIPFSMGTHEQRMDVVNLRYRGNPVVQISYFAGSGYVFTCKGSFDIHTDANNLKIRIPA